MYFFSIFLRKRKDAFSLHYFGKLHCGALRRRTRAIKGAYQGDPLKSSTAQDDYGSLSRQGVKYALKNHLA